MEPATGYCGKDADVAGSAHAVHKAVVGMIESVRPRDQAVAPRRIAKDRAGLLIIRIWIEPGSSEPLRAQVRVSNDIGAGFERTLMLSRPEAVCTAVQEWLAANMNDAVP